MTAINSFVNRYFGLILLAAAILGLFIPATELDISIIIIIALGGVIFSSYFRIELDKTIFQSDWRYLPVYFAIRFLVLPVIVYLIFIRFSVFYSTAFFLLLLLPAAVSSPAFAAMFGGNIGLALKILVFSSFLSILTLPLLSSIILSRTVRIDSMHMFLIMIYTIVIPFFLHLPFRRSLKIAGFMKLNIPVITAIGLMIIFVFSTAENRSVILQAPAKMLQYALISAVFYLGIYFIGYFLITKQDKSKRIAYSVCSGANNIGIGVTLTMLFFPGETNVLFIVSQLAWIFVLIPMRYFYRRIN
jgi:predicted Na+-dependent transporter